MPAPYVQQASLAPFIRQLPGIAGGLGLGELLEEIPLFGGAPSRAGGMVLASGWGDLFTPTGKLRGTFGVMQADGTLTFARNVGQPALFSREGTIAKRNRAKSGRMYRSCGGSTSRKR
jgi:hypothetical protein